MNHYIALGHIRIERMTNEIEMQPLGGIGLIEEARLHLADARRDAQAFLGSCMPSSLKHYLLWGAVGLTGTVSVLSGVVGTVALLLAGTGFASGHEDHLYDSLRADYLDVPEWVYSGALAGVSGTLSVGGLRLVNRIGNVIDQENAEILEALLQRIVDAEQRVGHAMANLQASEWEAFFYGLDDGQIASFMPSFLCLPEGRLAQVMERVFDAGLIHQLGLLANSPEGRAKLRCAYRSYGDCLVTLMEGRGIAVTRLNALELACMALSPTGFASSLPEPLRAELERPERRDQVHAAVHMLGTLAETLGIDAHHVHRFGDGVGGIGAELVAIAAEFPWVVGPPQP